MQRLQAGSYPRAWGTLGYGAGESFQSLVHPHGRGEHGRFGRCRGKHSGSSPRAWGTLLTGRRGTDKERFIPTGVGNT